MNNCCCTQLYAYNAALKNLYVRQSKVLDKALGFHEHFISTISHNAIKQYYMLQPFLKPSNLGKINL